MAGVSVQAFRRQGRRYGAGLVCSEMVSCAGIEHRNEKTLGYLRVASDEHPLAIQLFGSEPGPMADAARMVEAVGADIVDVNFGCPVKKVTKTGAGAHLLEDQDRACRIIEAIADAVDVPVTVKLRRGVHNGSRSALELGPRLVAVGASSLTLHPRSAQQMYTAQRTTPSPRAVSLVPRPRRSPRVTSPPPRARNVLADRRGAVMSARRAGKSVGAARGRGRR
jgi:tRNA-dihydrouridine synthase